MITIEKWTRYDNLPFSLENHFQHIREEAEYLNTQEEFEVYEFVEKKFMQEYPQFFKEWHFDDVIDVEYYPFEWEYGMEEDEFPGYAVYIHFHQDLVKKMVKHILVNQTEFVEGYYS
jgi:hypothetical protein